ISLIAPPHKILMQQLAKRRRHVTRHAAQAEPHQRAPKPVGQRAVSVEVDLVAERCLAFHALARDRDRCASTRELLLALAQKISAAEITDDLSQHITPAPRPRAATISFNEVGPAVRDL